MSSDATLVRSIGDLTAMVERLSRAVAELQGQLGSGGAGRGSPPGGGERSPPLGNGAADRCGIAPGYVCIDLEMLAKLRELFDACDLDGDESPTPTANAANSAAAWGEAAAVEEYSYDAWSGARWSD